MELVQISYYLYYYRLRIKSMLWRFTYKYCRRFTNAQHKIAFIRTNFALLEVSYFKKKGAERQFPQAANPESHKGVSVGCVAVFEYKVSS